MSGRTVPEKITVIVYGAKGLKPKHKAKHKFLVVFGVGNSKFRTDVVEDLFDNPVFNTESEITVEDPSAALTLVVSEKHEKDVLGQVVVHLSDLAMQRTNRPIPVKLQPHKKCPNPEGELSFEAWVSAAGSQPMLRSSPSGSVISLTESAEGKKHLFPAGFRKLRDKISLSPMLSRKGSDGKDHKRTLSDSLRVKSSVSCHDLASISSYHPPGPSLTIAPSGSHSSLESINEPASKPSSVSSVTPEVTGVSPRDGPIEGGTKVTIRGVSLGSCKEDVVGLFICGSNVLGTLEYVSPSKLLCTTKAWRACVGNVTVETQSGGKGSSLVQFTFTAPRAAEQPDSTPEPYSLSRSSSRGDADGKPPLSATAEGTSSTHTSNLPAMKNSLKAKSMFDLSGGQAPLRTSPPSAFVAVKPPKPEVTGISPKEGICDISTRLTIRGLNLGQSAADVTHLIVCGTDCIDTLEYESPSKLICFAGPWNPGKGDVIVETVSGGVGVCLVQFSFVKRAQGGGGGGGVEMKVSGVTDSASTTEESSWAAVPYSAEEPVVVAEVDAQRNSPVIRIERPSPKQPPPVGEIQPIQNVGKKGQSSPQHRSLFPWKRGSTADLQDYPLNGISETPETDGQNRSSMNSTHHEDSIKAEFDKEKLSELERKLEAVEDKSSKLQQDNITLREENERMRKYMESIVARAITRCPEILCVDNGKI